MGVATVILGAGASTPFLSLRGSALTTKLITTELLKNERWTHVWQQLSTACDARDPPRNDDRIDLDEVLHLRDRIATLLAATHFGSDNFEYIVHMLDKVAWYLAAPNDASLSCQWPIRLASHQLAYARRVCRSQPFGEVGQSKMAAAVASKRRDSPAVARGVLGRCAPHRHSAQLCRGPATAIFHIGRQS